MLCINCILNAKLPMRQRGNFITEFQDNKIPYNMQSSLIFKHFFLRGPYENLPEDKERLR